MSSNIIDRSHDRRVADLVNDLTSIAKKYGRAGQLRENISQRVSQFRREVGAIQDEAAEKALRVMEVIVQLVVCRDLVGAIGLDNGLPWEQATDMSYFKRATTGTVMIMGSSTFKSMGCRSLPGRRSIIITRNQAQFADLPRMPTVEFAKDFASAMVLARIRARELNAQNPIISIVGGGSIYREAMRAEVVQVVRETIVNTRTEGADTFFSADAYVRNIQWSTIHRESRFTKEADQYSQEFQIHVRKNLTSDPESIKRLVLGYDSYIGLPPKS